MIKQLCAGVIAVVVATGATLAAPTEKVAGVYYLAGAQEVGSELQLKEDGTFEWWLAYGAITQTESGTYHLQGDRVVLSAESPVKPGESFALQEMAPWSEELEARLAEIDHARAVEHCPFLQGTDSVYGADFVEVVPSVCARPPKLRKTTHISSPGQRLLDELDLAAAKVNEQCMAISEAVGAAERESAIRQSEQAMASYRATLQAAHVAYREVAQPMIQVLDEHRSAMKELAEELAPLYREKGPDEALLPTRDELTERFKKELDAYQTGIGELRPLATELGIDLLPPLATFPAECLSSNTQRKGYGYAAAVIDQTSSAYLDGLAVEFEFSDGYREVREIDRSGAAMTRGRSRGVLKAIELRPAKQSGLRPQRFQVESRESGAWVFISGAMPFTTMELINNDGALVPQGNWGGGRYVRD
ncbi:hypothetical protein [Lysobacter terrae]